MLPVSGAQRTLLVCLTRRAPGPICVLVTVSLVGCDVADADAAQMDDALTSDARNRTARAERRHLDGVIDRSSRDSDRSGPISFVCWRDRSCVDVSAPVIGTLRGGVGSQTRLLTALRRRSAPTAAP